VNNVFGKNLIFWLAIALLLIFLFNVFQGGPQSTTATGVQNVAYSDFMADAKSGRISNVTIQGQTLFGNFTNAGETFTTMVPPNENVVERLQGTGVQIMAEKEAPEKLSFLSILVSLLPAFLIIGVWILFMRQMQGRGRRRRDGLWQIACASAH
jgi:cell division protease FtsH